MAKDDPFRAMLVASDARLQEFYDEDPDICCMDPSNCEWVPGRCHYESMCKARKAFRAAGGLEAYDRERAEARCPVTGNIVGTDTHKPGVHPCDMETNPPAPPAERGDKQFVEVRNNEPIRIDGQVVCLHRWHEYVAGHPGGQRYSLMRLDEEKREWVPLESPTPPALAVVRELVDDVVDYVSRVKRGNATADLLYGRIYALQSKLDTLTRARYVEGVVSATKPGDGYHITITEPLTLGQPVTVIIPTEK